MSEATAKKNDSSLPVWVVDDDDVRLSLRFALATHNFNAMTFASGEDFLSQVDPKQPGCAVLDLTMPGLSGLQIQERLMAAGSPISVIMLSAHATIHEAVHAMEMGAVSFLEKPVDPDELARKVRIALKRSMQAWQHAQLRDLLNTLSRREAQIFRMICQGLKNADMAERLFLSKRTVEVHREHIAHKLGYRAPISLLYELVRETEYGELIEERATKSSPENLGDDELDAH